MVVVIVKSSDGVGFDIHAPEGFEDRESFRIPTHTEAMSAAEALVEQVESETGEQAYLSDESHLPN